MVLQLFQKTFSREQWPMISYTADEHFALHQVTNAVNVYDLQDPSLGVPLQITLSDGQLMRIAHQQECLLRNTHATLLPE